MEADILTYSLSCVCLYVSFVFSILKDSMNGVKSRRIAIIELSLSRVLVNHSLDIDIILYLISTGGSSSNNEDIYKLDLSDVFCL